MELRPGTMLACSAVALAIAGCGTSNDATEGANAPDPNDKRGLALQCITEEEDLDAQTSGEKSILVGGQPGGPRVEFFVSSGEAEGRQFQGLAEGSEQVGAALIFINEGSEEELESLERCLQDVQ